MPARQPLAPLPISRLGTGEGKPAWRLAAPVGIAQGLSHQSLGRQGAPACRRLGMEQCEELDEEKTKQLLLRSRWVFSAF